MDVTIELAELLHRKQKEIYYQGVKIKELEGRLDIVIKTAAEMNLIIGGLKDDPMDLEPFLIPIRNGRTYCLSTIFSAAFEDNRTPNEVKINILKKLLIESIKYNNVGAIKLIVVYADDFYKRECDLTDAFQLAFKENVDNKKAFTKTCDILEMVIKHNIYKPDINMLPLQAKSRFIDIIDPK